MTQWRGRQARFFPSLLVLLSPILFVLALRWLFFEPYVIPSSSMVPTLLINDFILVNKSHYGLRLPFTRTWLIQWNPVERGDVVVFKYPDRPETFFVKRIVAVSGDEIEVNNGKISINGESLKQAEEPVALPGTILDPSDYAGFLETVPKTEYLVMYSKEYGVSRTYPKTKVPKDHFFVMGDNRDNSSDSRIWGFVPHTHLMGRASLIWLSCENDTGLNFFNCESSPFRASRMGRVIR